MNRNGDLQNSEDNELAELISACQDGDQEAFHILFDKLNDRLFLYALSHVKSRDEALDMVQETFIELWKALPKASYMGDKAFYGFV